MKSVSVRPDTILSIVPTCDMAADVVSIDAPELSFIIEIIDVKTTYYSHSPLKDNSKSPYFQTRSSPCLL